MNQFMLYLFYIVGGYIVLFWIIPPYVKGLGRTFGSGLAEYIDEMFEKQFDVNQNEKEKENG